MMIQLDYRRYALPFRTPLRTAHGQWGVREGFLLRMRNEVGVCGYGEVAPIPGFGRESLGLDEVALARLGTEPTEADLAAVPESCACVRAALAVARAALDPSPVASTRRELIPVAALLPAGRAALAVIPQRLELGFRAFKWKVGAGDLADELVMLDDVLAALPSGAKLRLDANGAWDRRQSERWLERCAERPIEHLEQPVAPDGRGAVDVLMGLASDYPTPIALDESLVGRAEIDEWLQRGWPGVYVVKPTLIADPADALAKLAAAKSRVVFSSSLETAVGARSALSWAFAWPGDPLALGFGVWPLFQDERFDGPFLAPFWRRSDVERIEPESLWSALN